MMAAVGEDLMVVDDHHQQQGKESKGVKRKRTPNEDSLVGKDRDSLAAECRGEIEELFKYYHEVAVDKPQLELGVGLGGTTLLNSTVACLIEESSLSFSQLVDAVYARLNEGERNVGVNLASVRSMVLFVGQRMMYGIAPNPDADVLEDCSESCLWCWETRDMKLLPASHRGLLSVRRIVRKKVHERISALSATLSAFSTPESHENYNTDLVKASEKLGRALNGTGIRSLFEKLKQKNDADRADKEAKLKEKELNKGSTKNKQNAEKEQKRLDRKLQKEILRTEKEAKRLQNEVHREEKRREKEEAELKKQLKKQQEEAEREQHRHEKEEAELKKQLKKQQEEAEREQRRREKEEAEAKKQTALQKQATIMERFLKSRKTNTVSILNKVVPTEAAVPNPSCKQDNGIDTTATFLMDQAFSKKDNPAAEDLFKLHVAGWQKMTKSNRFSRWGTRRNPKIEVIKELKLQGSSSEADTPDKAITTKSELSNNRNCKSDDESPDKLVGRWEAANPDDMSQHIANAAPSCAQLIIKKLLQFDKSPRPAYYGTWHKKSGVIGPKHPLMKDPDLDYDVESDEEWEEEEPGESLSDCDKDDDEEHLEEDQPKSDGEDESEDGFFVPDGYLSENEGVQMQVDGLPDDMEEDAISSSCVKPETESDESRILMRQQKHLHSLTEKALRKNQPLVILNLMHEKSELIKAQGLTGTPKLEQTCLQALCMRVCPGPATVIDAPINHDTAKEQDAPQTQSKSVSSAESTAVIPDADLRKFVGSIRACSQGITKVVESLQPDFPTIPKSQLRNKVKEISDYVDNHWKVKKEVLDKLGLRPSPEKGRRPRSIATFFSKRCLPPVVKAMDICESSPEQSIKTSSRLNRDGPNSNTEQIQPAP